ncbi:MAG TPA: MCE family protein [Marmoricola sp.]|nr:MCE family protein [Marmoricola sp.]
MGISFGRRTRRTAATAVLAVTALAASSCSVYDIPLPGGPDTGDNPIHVKAKFRDVLDLVPQSTVKLDDVTVGKITDVKLDGYTAVVTMELPAGIDLPDNTKALIRQTSLLGEKFVSLSKPDDPVGELSDGDVIDLEDTGRNPEVEEVFGAMALLLNGGGVGQLKSISEELNAALSGREDDVRSVLTQIRSFMSQLDANKGAIINTLENLNRLALELRRQDGTIKATLDNIPAALRSIDSQRQDLVRMLRALQRLSGVGVQVINASKASTIESLRNLAPVLSELAKSGQDFPKSLQVFLTYPFVDAAVGRDPEVARNLHMGDYTNLSVDLRLDLGKLPDLPGLPNGAQSIDALLDQCEGGAAGTPVATVCAQLGNVVPGLLDQLGIPGVSRQAPSSPSAPKPKAPTPDNPLGGVLGGGGSGGGSDGGSLGGLLGGLGLGRAAPGFGAGAAEPDPFLLGPRGVDPGLGTLLLQGVAIK